MNKNRKGIILAGGNGSRLFPITAGISKQLLPIYDKPMIFYPISTLMLSNIKEILIITTSKDNESFKRLLGDGNKWGINISYAIQENPNGIAEAFLIGEKFLNKSPSVLILGDNLFHGSDFVKKLKRANQNNGATIFLYPVSDPSRYGIAELDINKKTLNHRSLKQKVPHQLLNLRIPGQPHVPAIVKNFHGLDLSWLRFQLSIL